MYDKNKIDSIITECNCYSDVLRKLNIKINGANIAYLKTKLALFKINISHFYRKSREKRCLVKRTIEDILSFRDSSFKEKSSILRKALIDSGVKYECNICNLKNIWQNNNLVLQIDHIDGNHFNNTKENLRFLCPNCHSQTDNFGSKNIKNKCIINTCEICKIEISNISKKCVKCNSITRKTYKFPGSEKLKESLTMYENDLNLVAKNFSVTATTVRKWIKKLK